MICAICEKSFDGHGHNPYPLGPDFDRCCDACKGKVDKANEYGLVDTSNKECPICSEAFLNGDETVVTECNHVFHKKCLSDYETYIGDVIACPTCRSQSEVQLTKVAMNYRYEEGSGTAEDPILIGVSN